MFAFLCSIVVWMLPGLREGLAAACDLLLGRPDIPADQLTAVRAIVHTPLVTLGAAGIYAAISRAIDHHRTDPTPRATTWNPTRSGPVATATSVLVHIFLAIAGSYALAIAMKLLGVPVQEQRLVLDLTASGDWRRPELATLIISALVLAPVAEELLFRHQLLRRTWQSTTPTAAYLASAGLFAVFHGNLQGLVVYFWLGLVFARCYAQTGRITAAIAVHMGNNAITLALLLTA